MALKTAKMFKDFYLVPNSDNTAVKLSAHDVVEVSVKNDNFSTQITIKDNGVTDFYNYKYITFDNSAIFEITDVIKNDSFYTLFIRYITNVIFDEFDADFYVDSISVQNLQKLGTDISTLFSVLGINAKSNIQSRYSRKRIDEDYPFLFFVKIRLSECPQNLSDALVIAEIEGDIYKAHNIATGKAITDSGYIATFSDFSTEELRDSSFFQVDSAFTVLLPIPYKINARMAYFDVSESKYYYPRGSTPYMNIDAFLERLNALISDLTISVEIVLLAANDIVSFRGDDAPVPLFEIQASGNEDFIIPFKSKTGISSEGLPVNIFMQGTIRDISNARNSDTYYPVICVNSWISTGGDTANKRFGIGEVFQPQKFHFLQRTSSSFFDNGLYVQMKILGNVIDLSTCPNDYVVLTRGVTGMRIYTDWNRRIYVDIENTLEFTRDAYSNYEAYKKANIELTQRQAQDSLRLQQEQMRKLQATQNAFGAASAGAGIVSNLARGNIFGAISGGIQAIFGGAQQNIEFNMQQENARANLELQQQQEREIAQDSVIPTSELRGSITLSDFTHRAREDGITYAGENYLAYCTVVSILLTENDYSRRLIERYIFDNTITERVIANVTAIKKPNWQTLHKFYQVKLKKNSVLCNKKDCLIFVEDNEENN